MIATCLFLLVQIWMRPVLDQILQCNVFVDFTMGNTWQEIDADGFSVCRLQPNTQSEMLSKTFDKQCKDLERCKHLRTNIFAG